MKGKLSIEISAQVASRIVCSVLGLVLITQLSRYVSVEDFGVYTLSFTVLAFFSPVVEIGLNTIAIREIARTPEKGPAIFSSVIAVKLLMAVLAFGGAVSFALWLGNDARQQTVIILTSLGLFNLVLGTLDILLIVSHRMLVWAGIQIVAGLVGLSGVMAMIWAGLGLPVIVLVQVGSLFVVYALAFLYLRREMNLGLPDRRMVFYLVRESLPQGISGVITAYYFNVDMVMVAKMVGTEGVAFYGAAYRLLNLMCFVPHAIMMTFMPILTRALATEKEDFSKLFRYVFHLMLFLALPIALWVGWFAEDIITLIYSSTYQPAAAALRILVWAGVGVFLSHLSGYALVILGRQKTGMIISATTLALNVALNFWLIKTWGFLGAACATVICEMFVIFAGYGFCYHYQRVVPFSQKLVRSFVASIVMLVVLVVGRGHFYVTSMVAVVLISAGFFWTLREKERLS